MFFSCSVLELWEATEEIGAKVSQFFFRFFNIKKKNVRRKDSSRKYSSRKYFKLYENFLRISTFYIDSLDFSFIFVESSNRTCTVLYAH